MKAVKIISIILAIALSIATATVCVIEKEYLGTEKLSGAGWVYGLSYTVSIIALLLSTSAHSRQLSNQQEIKDILKRQKTKAQQNGIPTFKYQPSAIVEIALYAMKQASTHRPIKVDKITPNDVEIFSVVIDSICSAYNPDILYAFVDRNNMLVVPKYDPNNLPTNKVEDGSFVNSYSKKDRTYIERAKKRIDEEVNN